MAEYSDLTGDAIDLVSGAPIASGDMAKFSSDEKKDFDATYEHVVRMINRLGAGKIFNSKHYDLCLHTAQLVKKRFGELTFTGDGTGGFGMRAIIPEDIYSNANDVSWELANGTVATNWTAGAPATRWLRNDHGFTQRDAGTFTAGGPAITRDANNDMWYVLYWGLMDSMASGLPQGYMVSLNNRPRAFKDISLQMTSTDFSYAELGYGVLYEPTVPFKTGLQIKDVDVATTARVLQVIAMRPIGVTFCTQRRQVLDNGTITRPAQA